MKIEEKPVSPVFNCERILLMLFAKVIFVDSCQFWVAEFETFKFTLSIFLEFNKHFFP